MVKTLVYQPMDRGSNPDEGNFFFFFFFKKMLKSLSAYMHTWRGKG